MEQIQFGQVEEIGANQFDAIRAAALDTAWLERKNLRFARRHIRIEEFPRLPGRQRIGRASNNYHCRHQAMPESKTRTCPRPVADRSFRAPFGISGCALLHKDAIRLPVAALYIPMLPSRHPTKILLPPPHARAGGQSGCFSSTPCSFI